MSEMKIINYPKMRVRVSPEQIEIKKSLGITWDRVVDLGIEKASEITSEIDSLVAMNAHTVVWQTSHSNLRVSPARRNGRANTATAIMMFYIIGIAKTRKGMDQMYRVYYKNHRLDNLKTMDLPQKKIRFCVMEEFGLNNELRVEL